MIFNNGKIYAKVWKVTPSENGKYIDLQISTSEKGEDGEYLNSSWFPRCIGKSINTLKGIKRGDRIIITKSKFTNERRVDDDGAYRSYFKFLIYEAEIEKGFGAASPQKEQLEQEAQPEKEVTENEADCPW